MDSPIWPTLQNLKKQDALIEKTPENTCHRIVQWCPMSNTGQCPIHLTDQIEKKIVRGLVKLVELDNLESGIRLSPHWILLNENDSVFIRVESGIEKKDEQDKPSLPTNTLPSVSHTGMKDEMDEIRYRAPEQGEKEGELKEGVDESRVIVFRVGLVLWEIETGVVPFGEVDGVEAHSKLSAGIGVPLEKVSDTSMRELIEGCLQIDADERMTLEQVLARLQGIPEGSGNDE
ncbi:hypothetical protein BLNAU_2073 [Blattamonas nauphoetae]|uniref:Protein kinase domain-containing protein n=1 Tax=Blattamonas nauphoetae TaxID=2049346 RepID=A0ABQ9YHC5_9EUKA|nr:hypothetical protein BLNAU_2073 [Blattamonas nauphoetae]